MSINIFVHAANPVMSTHVTAPKEAVFACVAPKQQNERELLDKLKWVSSKKHMCGGTYTEKQIKKVPGFQLTADEMDISLEGKSTVRGKVLVHHDDKILSAKLANIYRHEGQVKEIELIDNVEFNEPNHTILANKGRFLVQDYSGSLFDILYRLKLADGDSSLLSNTDSLVAWGKACFAKRDSLGNLTLSHVTYSTCPPNKRTWDLKAKEIKLNKKESKGVAQQAVLYFKDFPFLYLPYISFPLDTKRKSGFIGSELALTSQSGIDYRFPYYINIAPNLDATLYPHYLSRRGFMFGGEFRYLYPWGSGISQLHFLPNDKAFKNFKEANLWVAPQLATLSNNRYSFKWLHDSNITTNLSLHIDLETVSDDYYLQDFNNNLSVVSDNQLLRQLRLNYTTDHWNYNLVFQDYQTLHPFNQSTTNGVYARVPSLSGVGLYQELPYHLQLGILMRLDNFLWQGDNASLTPQGYRFHLSPTLSWLEQKEGYYFNPKFTLHSSHYDLKNYNGMPKTLSRLIPISSLDMGLQLERPVFYSWRQTLEPRLYYLYVPYVKQYEIPEFDTGNYLPTFNQLFRDNRFSGLDRVGDANQISYGLSSRFIDSFGIEQLKLSVGGFYKLQREKVSICQNLQGSACNDSTDRFGYTSPAAGLGPTVVEADLKLSSQVSMLGSIALDLRKTKVNNALVNFHYEPMRNHIINAGFGFIVNGDPIQLANVSEADINLKQFRLSYAWPYNAHWRSVGAWSYNLSHAFSTSYLVGVQYDDCCMALRFLGGRAYRNYNPNGAPTYSNNVYLQILLKGLGSAANNDPGGVIKNFLPTFVDDFK